MISFLRFLVLFAFAAVLFPAVAAGQSYFFPNASFEEDTPNLGWPDSWKKEKGVEGELVNSPVSDGRRAMKFTNGYGVLSHNFQVENLAGAKVTITCDAISPDGARFGIITGYMIRTENGGTKWVTKNSPWNLNLSDTWRKGTYTIDIRKDAIDGRLYIGFFRSNQQGTLFLDNLGISIIPGNTKLTADGLKEFARLSRDFRYLKAASGDKVPESAGYEEKLLKLATQDDAALSAFIAAGELGRLRALAVRRACKDAQPLGWLDNPCERQNLNLPFPSAPKKELKLFALNNEWQALGVEIANPDPEPRTVKFDLSGFEAFDRVQFRRVVALENWYKKENELTPDALTLLKDNELVLEPGEHTRLYLAFKTKTPGTFQVKINDLAATVTVSPKSLPETEFANFQFLYPWLPPFTGKAFAVTVRDLAEHYTTDVEFPPLPDVTFNQDGTVAQDKIAGGRAERVFKMFAAEKIRSVFYWMGQRKSFKYADGSKVPFNTDELDKSAPPNVLTPQWETVYPALVHAWMNHVRKLGLEQWMASLPFDEAHSGKETAPGSNLYMVRKIYELTRAAEPKLPRYLTCGHWTLPEDIELVLPELDVAVIHWPQPDDYRGKPIHKIYVEKVLPMLKEERAKRGLKIWSYRVEGGKNVDPNEERSYPLAMAGWGVSGVGTWAYYVSSGHSWDDTDGKILDYCFIYDGLEKHPICEKYNLTGEAIVPSLRWEALRLGIQDAKILLALPPSPEAEQLKKECAEIAVSKKWDIQRLLQISRRLRELWAQQSHKEN